ncbi:hypothetical protein ACFL6G_05035 [candidate division KSB1 bacterium]
MIRQKPFYITVIFLLIFSFQVQSQEKTAIDTDTRIRLTLTSQENALIGKFSGVENNSVKIFSSDDNRNLLIPINDVSRLDVFKRDSFWSKAGKGAKKGVKIGVITGAAVGALGGAIAYATDSGSDGEFGAGAILIDALIVGVIGIELGAIIGAAVYAGKEDLGKWENVPVDLLKQDRITRSHGTMLIKLSFSLNK